MEPSIDTRLADHVLRSHGFRAQNEADGEALHIDTAADVVIVEDPQVRGGEAPWQGPLVVSLREALSVRVACRSTKSPALPQQDEKDETTPVFQKHNVQLHGSRGRSMKDRILHQDFLKKYILYAKATV